MTIILFLLIIGALIFVHELGHFLFAKKAGMRVDEFSIGFPPRIFSKKKGGTKYTIGLIPFGGYVKIFGENPEEIEEGPNSPDLLTNKSRWWQSLVVIGGVLFNIIFAWILFWASFMIGSTIPLDYENDLLQRGTVSNERVMITGVMDDSPAEKAGLIIGDKILSLEAGSDLLEIKQSEQVIEFINLHSEEEVTFTLKKNGDVREIDVRAIDGIAEDKKAVGIALERVGTVRLNPIQALGEATVVTGQMTWAMTIAIIDFIGELITNDADLSTVAGPVGIVGLVDDASQFGLVHVLIFTALISLNLAIINLMPFPALDGGRLLFIIIEGIIRRPINIKVAHTLNIIGFLLLLLLMILLTVSDIGKLF